LVPLATIVTPNLPEAQILGPLPGVVMLRKGGHAEGDGGVITDTLERPGRPPVAWRHPRRHTPNTHGTGCTLSAAIAARLALGADLESACGSAIDYVAGLILRSAGGGLGSGHGPLFHGVRDGARRVRE
jgi:hydroxymethylpyrimidine/phosphomethylpyrimidine kinase